MTNFSAVILINEPEKLFGARIFELPEQDSAMVQAMLSPAHAGNLTMFGFTPAEEDRLKQLLAEPLGRSLCEKLVYNGWVGHEYELSTRETAEESREQEQEGN